MKGNNYFWQIKIVSFSKETVGGFIPLTLEDCVQLCVQEHKKNAWSCSWFFLFSTTDDILIFYYFHLEEQ